MSTSLSYHFLTFCISSHTEEKWSYLLMSEISLRQVTFQNSDKIHCCFTFPYYCCLEITPVFITCSVQEGSNINIIIVFDVGGVLWDITALETKHGLMSNW